MFFLTVVALNFLAHVSVHYRVEVNRKNCDVDLMLVTLRIHVLVPLLVEFRTGRIAKNVGVRHIRDSHGTLTVFTFHTNII